MDWTRDQLLIVINLYYRLPFGKQDARNNEVITLANKLGRTPGSIAMKLNNLTSLDPEELKRGVKGLSGTSQLDREIWAEFHANRNELSLESQNLTNGLFPPKAQISYPKKVTEKQGLTNIRIGQQFFRNSVLGCFNHKCCISGIPVPQLLRASHIIPWKESEEHRLNPRNGLCLAATYDAAFDRGLIALTSDYKIIVHDLIKQHISNSHIKTDFVDIEGKSITLPEKNLPDRKFLQWHREHIFKKL